MERGRIGRRDFVKGVFATAVGVSAPSLARASAPMIRYATGGGIGPNGIDTLFFTDFMRQRVLKGYGKSYTLSVVYTRGTPEAASLLAAGQADLASQACTSFATALSRGIVTGGLTAIADVHDVRAGYSKLPFYVLQASQIRSVEDLRGKTLAVNAYGTITDLVARSVLKRSGLDPKKDLRIVEISFPSIGPALREGRIDAGVLPVPFGPIEDAKGNIRELFNATDAFGTFSSIFQVARTRFLEESPDAVRAWLDDYVVGLHWLYDPANRRDAVALAAEVSKSTPEILEGFFLTEKDYYRNPNGCLNAGLLQPPIDAMFQEGLLAKRVDVSPHVDMKYLPKPC